MDKRLSGFVYSAQRLRMVSRRCLSYSTEEGKVREFVRMQTITKKKTEEAGTACNFIPQVNPQTVD